MEIRKDIRYRGSAGREATLDVYYDKETINQGTILFVHGFKGFKDWGHWHLCAKALIEKGFAFINMNLTHNGTSPDQPADFVDLEAFGHNTYSKSLFDIDCVLNLLFDGNLLDTKYFNPKRVFMIGHSMGGALAIIKSSLDSRINKLVTWASISEVGFLWRDHEILKEWKENGIRHIHNGRTKQDMPLYFDMVEDFNQNKNRYSIYRAINSLKIPWLILHGDQDPAVDFKQAMALHEQYPGSHLEIVSGADHVFQGRHPWMKSELPKNSDTLISKTASFLKEGF